MKVSADQLLLILSKHAEPLSVSQITAEFDTEVTNRTVRRLLSSLVTAGKVEKFGQSRATKYQLKHRRSSHFIFSDSSLKLIEKVRRPIYERDICTYNESWLLQYQPNETFYLNQLGRAELLESTNHNMTQLPAGTYARKIFNRMLIDLSFNSSRLEGNTYSLIDTEKLVLQGHAAEGKLDAEKLMILNHKEAIRYLVDNANRLTVSVENIRTLHFLLSDSLVATVDAGNIRRDTVRVSATTYIPLDNREKLTSLLSKVIETAQKINDPFEQSFFLLVHIAYLQAFIDVNKRTSRLAANIPLVSHNLSPLSFNDVDNHDYIDSLIAVYEHNDISPLADLYVWSYTRSAKLYRTTAESMSIDVIKATYRKEIRYVIAQVVSNVIYGDQLKAYVSRHAEEMIPIEHREEFIDDVVDELLTLEIFKVTGMGISSEQFNKWYALMHS